MWYTLTLYYTTNRLLMDNNCKNRTQNDTERNKKEIAALFVQTSANERRRFRELLLLQTSFASNFFCFELLLLHRHFL